MLHNYFKTAFRSLLRNKVYTLINILGLAIGIASALLIFLVVQFELSIDTYHQNYKEIYHLLSYDKQEGDYSPGVPLPTKNALKLDFPELKQVANISSREEVQVDVEAKANTQTKRFKEDEGVFYVEPEFFEIFDFTWVIGDPKNSLDAAGKVVLSESIARKYFGSNQKAMGKTLQLDQVDELEVSGIIKDAPQNTDFPLAIVASYKTLTKRTAPQYLNEWGSISSSDHVYMRIPSTLNESIIRKRLKDLVVKHRSAGKAEDFAFVAQKLKDIHYDDRAENFSGSIVGREIIMGLIMVGFFLVIVACINFVNLATAQAVNRSREVGVRKVMGSSRQHLLYQFLGETFILVLFSVILAIALAELVIPQFSKLLDIPISLNVFQNPVLLLFLLGITLVVTLLAGFYPALIMSSFNPVQALKSKITPKVIGGFSLRRGLVIVQFALAQILIIGMLVGIFQMQFIRSLPLGFDKEAIVTIPIPTDSVGFAMSEPIDQLRREISQFPGVLHVSFANRTPSSNSNWAYNFNLEGKHKLDDDVDVEVKMADTAYFSTYGLQLVAGRVYQSADTINELVVNETLVKKFGFKKPEDIIGVTGLLGGRTGKRKIVGVVKDFHTTSLHKPITPCVISTRKNHYYEIGLKVESAGLKNTLKALESTYSAAYPKHLFEYKFLNDTITEYYEFEGILITFIRVFACIGIFISCLGLYGLVSFMAVQRNKEVGIRKVLGATFQDICMIYYREFTVLILIAFFIATPLAWYFMSAWLQNFAYRIPLHWWIFALAGLGVALLAVLIISFKALRSARVNPIEALRYE